MNNIQQSSAKRDRFGGLISLRTFSCIGFIAFTGETVPCGKLVETDSRVKKRCMSCSKKQIQQTTLKQAEKKKLKRKQSL